MSRSLYLRIDLLEEAKRRNINLSRLVNQLLENYLYGNNSNVSQDLLKIMELKQQIEEIKERVSKLDEIEVQLDELIKEKKEEQEIQQAEEDSHLITLIKEHPVLSKLNDFWTFKHETEKTGNTVEGVVNTNLDVFAQKNNISLRRARDLFFKAFPEMREQIKI
jgi:TolA-binding protein